MNTTKFILMALTAAAVAACGGGGGDDSAIDPTGSVPPDAVGTGAAYADFVGRQTPDDQAEPLDVTGVLPPTSETDEPKDLG